MWGITIDRKGCTRTVVLTTNYAIKFPTLSSWQGFLRGLLANCKERLWCRCYVIDSARMLPPVLWVCPGGWFSIQHRVKPIQHRGLFYVELWAAIKRSNIPEDFWLSDVKPENFGWYKNRLVKIDIG